ncbi:hypothetical protein ACFQDN_21530 [Pseudomonas asuensis]
MGSFLEGAVDTVEHALAYAAKYMIGKDLVSYCELLTALVLTDDDRKRHPDFNDPYALFTETNSILTVCDMQGLFQGLSPEEYSGVIENISVSLNPVFQRPGYSLSFCFERDPDRALDELMKLAEPQIKTARRIGLETEDIILDRVKRNAPLVAFEQNLLVIYTHPTVMGSDEIKREMKSRSEAVIKHNLPRLDYAQDPAAILAAMKYRHDTMVERVMQIFMKSGTNGRPGVLIRPISAHDAIKRVRLMVNRERTSHKFRPVLIGDPYTPRGREDDKDYSDLAPPQIRHQICSNDVDINGRYVKTHNLLHSTISLELGPQLITPFSKLLGDMDREIPWRIRFDLEPGGLNQMRSRRMITAFAGLFPNNKEIRQSFIDLEATNREEPVLSMKVMASTWADSEEKAKRRLAVLDKSLQGWGVCQTTTSHGDPFAAFASSIPAFTSKNCANRLVPPLTDAIRMMPLERPATPWPDGGNLILRTPDGKIYPVQQGSRLQDTWIDLVSATPGAGKSVLLNTMLTGTLHNPGASRLPLITFIDVSNGESGFVRMVQDGLPEHRKHEALGIKLQNSLEFAVNPFDTQLGARFPTSAEMTFLIDFLTLFSTNPAKKRAIHPECARVNELIIKAAYTDRASKNQNAYEEEVEVEVDKVLESSGIKAKYDSTWWSAATWWEITDLLFEAGYVREAAIAQRQAVPVFIDFPAYLNSEAVRQTYGTALLDNGEPLLQAMSRSLSYAANKFKLFAGRTRFELNDESRIVALNLHGVMGTKTDEGHLQTAIMFMFARQVAAKNYFLHEDELNPVIPDIYREYHAKRINDVKDELKVIAYEEFHNTKGQEAFVNTVIRDGREVRNGGYVLWPFHSTLRIIPQNC